MAKKTNKTIEEQDRDKYLALNLLVDTDGGRVILNGLLKDIAHIVGSLSSRYRDESHFELVRLCADLNAKLSLYQALTNAEQNLKDVEVVIKEAIENKEE